MTIVVVAMTFVSEARSNSVPKSVPKASVHSRSLLVPTSTVAAGKTPVARPSSTMRRASSTDTAHHQADTHADRRARQYVPGPRERGEHANGDHRDQRNTDAGHHTTLIRGFGQDAHQE